jgi:glycyl-tRNA synthetase beta subunit
MNEDELKKIKNMSEKVKKMSDMMDIMILHFTVQSIKPRVLSLYEEGKYTDCFELLIKLDEPVNTLLDNVKIKDSVPKIKEKCLLVLSGVRDLYDTVTNFEGIKGERSDGRTFKKFSDCFITK